VSPGGSQGAADTPTLEAQVTAEATPSAQQIQEPAPVSRGGSKEATDTPPLETQVTPEATPSAQQTQEPGPVSPGGSQEPADKPPLEAQVISDEVPSVQQTLETGPVSPGGSQGAADKPPLEAQVTAEATPSAQQTLETGPVSPGGSQGAADKPPLEAQVTPEATPSLQKTQESGSVSPSDSQGAAVTPATGSVVPGGSQAPSESQVSQPFDGKPIDEYIDSEIAELFNREEPVIYVGASIADKHFSDNYYNALKQSLSEVFSDFDDISVKKNVVIDYSCKFMSNFLINSIKANNYLTDVLKLKVEGKNNTLKITGMPPKSYDDLLTFCLKITVTVNNHQERKFFIFKKEMYIAPDPKDLWKNLEVTDFEGYEYQNERCESFDLANIGKVLTAATVRGRSHAHVGKPRDDNYAFDCQLNSGWNVAAVADGAGSAKFSRKGSDLACLSVVDYVRKTFDDGETLAKIEDAILHLREIHIKNSNNSEYNPTINMEALGEDNILNRLLYNSVATALKAIDAECKKKQAEPKYKDVKLSDYHTTLLFMIFKKFTFGYFFASFWIGDGAIVLYGVNGTGKVEVLGVPDSGEFAGQTRFLTMPGEVTQEKVNKRTRFLFADSFGAIILVTDGITDAFFPSESATLSEDKWKSFWTKTLREGDGENPGCPALFNPAIVPEAKAQALLKWLDFWSKGNHDDRTILIVK
jgi:serine/threonine protein phosphatase PrpC